MPELLRVGVLGTLVCDVIYGPPPTNEFSEGWGGIAYALSGLGAALANEWEVVPLIKVGADVIEDARPWVSALPRMSARASLVPVPEPNNRSELRYFAPEHRTERMSGGVPGWSFAELRSALDDARLDALYVNFLSGWEVDLATMQQVRAHFHGPIYVDLHMMLWQADSIGRRSLRPLADAAAWCACFDFIQVNEEELRMLADTPAAFAQLATGEGALATFVTLGSRGVQYHARSAFQGLRDRDALRRPVSARESLVSGVHSPSEVRAGSTIDPTGCGDVWGGTMFARLLAGDLLPSAIAVANRAASLNASSHGVTGLAPRLLVLRTASSALPQ